MSSPTAALVETTTTNAQVNRAKTDQDRVDVLIKALEVIAAYPPLGEEVDYESKKWEEEVKMLLAVFDCYANGIEFTKEEEALIADLMYQSLEGLGVVMAILSQTSTQRGPEALKIRSAFQFIFDHFRWFRSPNVGNNLEKLLDPMGSFNSWDMVLLGWRGMFYDLPEQYDNMIPEEIARQYMRPDRVPDTHFWWVTPERPEEISIPERLVRYSETMRNY